MRKLYLVENTNTLRYHFLDGLRGWGAIMVLLSHTIMCFLLKITPEYDTFLFKFITDGHLAVLTFFVLSGFVLSIISANTKFSLFKLIVARYLRLMLPVLTSTLIIWAFFYKGYFYNLDVVKILPVYHDWLGTFYTFDPSFIDAIRFSFFDVFFNYQAEFSYNSSLWTMRIELIGSIIIFMLPKITEKEEKKYWRIIIFIAFVVLLLKPTRIYSSFIFGYLLAKLYVILQNSNIKNHQFELISVFLFIIIILISTFFRPSNDVYGILMAVSIVYAVLTSSILKNFFENKFSLFLGKISFSLYLIHIAVISSLSSYMLLHRAIISDNQFIVSNVITLTTIIISVFIAFILTPVDKYSIIVSKRIVNFSSEYINKYISRNK